jgi:outer membrane protein assembly factor BamB
MRYFTVARVAAVVFSAAAASVEFAGCSGSGGSSLPATAARNGASVTGSLPARAIAQAQPAASTLNPALTIAPRLLDSGAHGAVAPAATYVGYHVGATDANSPANAQPDSAAVAIGTYAAPAEPNGRTDTGSHAVTITGITSAQAVVTSNQSYNLTYVANGHPVDYQDIVAHFSASGSALPATISAEYVGGSGAAAFDVRAACASAAPLDAMLGRFTCPIPAYGASTARSSIGSGSIVPGAAGLFTPTAAKIYFVLTYASTPAAGTSTVLGIDNVYAATCAGSSCASRAATMSLVKKQTTPDWPAFNQNNQHLSYVDDPNMNTGVAPTLGVNWMSNLYDADLGSPIAAFNSTLGETVAYAGNERGDLFAFNEANGKAVYSTSLGVGDSIRATPLYTSDGALWVGTNFYPTLYKLNAATGQQQCSGKQILQIESSPEVATPSDGVETVYDGDIDGYTSGPWFATNEANCANIWSFTGYASVSGPWASTAYGVTAKGEGIVVVGTADPDSREYAVDAITGQLVWEYKVANPNPYQYDIGASTTISEPGTNGFADGVAYVPTKYGILYALDLTTGALIWQYNFNAAFGVKEGGRSAAALDGNTLVLGYFGGVFAVNATTGQLLWQYKDPTGYEVIGSPAIVGPPGSEVVAAADAAGQFHVLSLATGASLYQYQTAGFIAASVAYVNGHFLVTGGDGFLYDFALNGSNAPRPTTTLTFPAQGATVPNPNGNLVVTGTATDSTSIAGATVAVQSGGPEGPWYNAATNTWNSSPVANFVPVASPGSPSSTWTFPFPVPPAGGTYQVFANGVDTAKLQDTSGALAAFTVSTVAGVPVLTLSAPYIAPGSGLTATASSFQPNETVAFTLTGNTLGTAVANGSGTAVANLTIPTNAALGLSSIVATGQTSHDTATAALAITNAWSEYGDTALHTFFESNDTILKHELSIDHGKQFLQLAWYFQAGGSVESSPAILDGVAYFGNDNGAITAVNTATSSPVWSYQTLSSQPIKSQPAIDPSTGLLLFTSNDSNLYTLGLANGEPAANPLQLSGTLTSPNVVNGVAYVASSTGTLWALKEGTNAVVWQAQLGGAVSTSPLVDTADNVVVVGDSTGAVTAFGVGSGAVRWSYLTSGPVTAAPADATGVIYVGSTDGNVYAISAPKGTLIWKQSAGSPVTANIAVDTFAHIINVGTQSGEFLGFTPAGKQILKNLSSTAPIVSLSAVESVVVGLRTDGSINLFRPDQDGATLFVYQTNASLDTTAAIINGAVFVGAEDGGLYALTSNGKAPINVINDAKNPPRLMPSAKLTPLMPSAKLTPRIAH